MNKCWYCGKELKNENNKEHIGICDKCYQESFEVGNKFVSNLIEKQTDKDQKIADLEAKLAEKEKEIDKLEDKLHHYYEETLNKGTCGLCEHLRGEYKTDFAIEQILDIKEKSFGTRETKLVFDIPPVQDVFDNIESKLKELMGDKYE